MAGKLLTRIKQIAVEIESVEGTAETFVAAAATMLVYDPSYTPDIQRFARNPARSTLSMLKGITGKQAAAIGWSTEFKGSGAIGTEPAWSKTIQACGFSKSAVNTVAIGAITSGPFEPGETITGAGAGTGRVVGEVTNGAAAVHYVVLSGAIGAAELITGGTSGATATTAGSPATDKGFEYKPSSSSVVSDTVGLYENGLRKIIHGARGNLTIECVVGDPVFLTFAMTGVYNAETDTALLASVPYEATVPKAFINVGATVVADTTPCFVDLTFDMANEVVPRECANEAKGILSYLITTRDPTAQVNPEKKLVADNDTYGDLIAGTEGRLYIELPGSAGEKMIIASPRVAYRDLGRSDRSGLMVSDITLELIAASVSTGDDELQIAMI